MTYYVTPLTTLDDVLQQQALKDLIAADSTANVQNAIESMNTNTVASLKGLLYEVSDEIQRQLDRRLTPYEETKSFYRDYLNSDAYGYDRQSGYRYLHLDRGDGDDIVSVSSVTWNTTALTASQYRLRHPNSTPNYEMVFDPDVTLDTLTDFTDSVDIAGIWGYHHDYANAWQDTSDTVQNATEITASGTGLSVTNAENFETYQLLKIESEFLFVTDISGTTLTVERGVNGTTAASHANAISISKFVPIPAVAKECRRLVVRAYFMRNPVNSIVVSEQTIKDLVDTNIRLRNLERIRFYSI